MMKSLKMIFVLGILVLQSISSFSQVFSPKIAIVNQVDSLATHVYVDPMHVMSNTQDIFDYGEYSVKELIGKFEASQIEALELHTPVWFNNMSYMNFIGKPTKQFKAWLTTLKQQYDVDYLIVILHKWNPDPDINFKFLDQKHYGIASYSTNRDAITLFSLVGYWIFSTGDFREIQLNSNHDRYVITNVSLIDRLSFREIKDLPDTYYQLTRDKLRNVADTRNAEIWRVMNQEIGK
jgi:hypothetical protein